MSNYPPYDAGPGYPPSNIQRSDDRVIAILAHLSPVIAMILSAGFLSWLGPLLIWIIWRDRGPLVRNASATAFNFNITVWLAIIIGWILFFTLIGIPIAIVLWVGAAAAQVIFSIIGALRANRYEVYTYPLQVPILT